MGRLHTVQKFRHYNGDGRMLWASSIDEDWLRQNPVYRGSRLEDEVVADQVWLENALADGGEQGMLEVYFRGATAPTNIYLRLFNDTPVDTDTMATLTGEVTGTGYNGIELERNSTGFPTSALDSGDWRIVSKVVTWTNSGGSAWGAATYVVLASSQSGTGGVLIAYNALSATRTLQPSDSLDVSMALKAA